MAWTIELTLMLRLIPVLTRQTVCFQKGSEVSFKLDIRQTLTLDPAVSSAVIATFLSVPSG